ncbi:MAG TPA: AraC family transcriptional regulator [Flavitalea sp.]|nr:AraC family transcriptional regulator [Flavitalea sp.]
MKVLQFTIPVTQNKTIIVQQDVLPYFYPHLHRHEEIQLTWIQKGEGTLIAHTNMHAFRSNEIYFLGANQAHVFKSDHQYFSGKSLRKVQSLTIFFNPDGRLAHMLDFPELKLIRQFLNRTDNGFRIPEKYVTEISGRMLKIEELNGVEQILQFIDLLRVFSQMDTGEPLVSGSRNKSISEHEGIRIGAIYDYILQHYDIEITLEDVAAQAHMTPQAFCRYFKKHTRHTFISFLNEVRINEACKQLTEGSYESISTVAYDCGFKSITNFNRVFKTVTGQSPGTYRREFMDRVE